MNKQWMPRVFALACFTFLAGLGLFFGVARGQDKPVPVVAGVSFDFLRERWVRDGQALSAESGKQSVKLLVKSSESNDELQLAQSKEMVKSGAQVLLVVPHDFKKAGEVVNYAHSQKVKVIAYDRIIRDCDLDYYVSFDNQKVGELQAGYALSKAPSGNYVLLAGSSSDNNAILVHAAWLKVLGPAIKSGKIKIGFDRFTPDWNKDNARKNMELALKTLGADISVVIAGNDNLAEGAIKALEASGLGKGKVIVIGQDAELDALQRIKSGAQSMTIYKPIPKLASAAIELAVKTVRGEKVNHLFTRTVNNGFKDVPSILLEPVVVDKQNLDKNIGQDGFYGH